MRQLFIQDLPISPADPDSPIPLYYQVEADLRELLKNTESGDMLPPETELAEAYGVGRHTIRVALGRLVADNLISRRAGHGTVIKPVPDRRQFYLDRSFTRQMAEMGLKAHSTVLKHMTGQIQSNAPKPLQGKLGAPFFALHRLRFGNGEPIGLQYSTIITELCHGLEKHDFAENSLYAILSSHFQLEIVQITHTIAAVMADKKQADLLQVREGDALLVVKTSAYVANNELIEYTISYYRADKYEYNITHTYAP